MLLKLKDALKKALFFFRITDDGSKVSITYTACWVVIIKIALAPEPSIVEMGGLLVVLAAHYGKKTINKGKAKLTKDQEDLVSALKTRVENLSDKVGAMSVNNSFKR